MTTALTLFISYPRPRIHLVFALAPGMNNANIPQCTYPPRPESEYHHTRSAAARNMSVHVSPYGPRYLPRVPRSSCRTPPIAPRPPEAPSRLMRPPRTSTSVPRARAAALHRRRPRMAYYTSPQACASALPYY